jgi:hypothetical protein
MKKTLSPNKMCREVINNNKKSIYKGDSVTQLEFTRTTRTYAFRTVTENEIIFHLKTPLKDDLFVNLG